MNAKEIKVLYKGDENVKDLRIKIIIFLIFNRKKLTEMWRAVTVVTQSSFI